MFLTCDPSHFHVAFEFEGCFGFAQVFRTKHRVRGGALRLTSSSAFFCFFDLIDTLPFAQPLARDLQLKISVSSLSVNLQLPISFEPVFLNHTKRNLFPANLVFTLPARDSQSRLVTHTKIPSASVY